MAFSLAKRSPTTFGNIDSTESHEDNNSRTYEYFDGFSADSTSSTPSGSIRDRTHHHRPHNKNTGQETPLFAYGIRQPSDNNDDDDDEESYERPKCWHIEDIAGETGEWVNSFLGTRWAAPYNVIVSRTFSRSRSGSKSSSTASSIGDCWSGRAEAGSTRGNRRGNRVANSAADSRRGSEDGRADGSRS